MTSRTKWTIRTVMGIVVLTCIVWIDADAPVGMFPDWLGNVILVLVALFCLCSILSFLAVLDDEREKLSTRPK